MNGPSGDIPSMQKNLADGEKESNYEEQNGSLLLGIGGFQLDRLQFCLCNSENLPESRW